MHDGQFVMVTTNRDGSRTVSLPMYGDDIRRCGEAIRSLLRPESDILHCAFWRIHEAPDEAGPEGRPETDQCLFGCECDEDPDNLCDDDCPACEDEAMVDIKPRPDIRDLNDEEQQDAVEDFVDWWTNTADDDLQHMLPKREEYGAADLRIMGKALQELTKAHHIDGVELAIGFYALGKVARLFGAWEAGRPASDDTWHDLTVYSMMARAIREGQSL